jgi:hypothetical protein
LLISRRLQLCFCSNQKSYYTAWFDLGRPKAFLERFWKRLQASASVSRNTFCRFWKWSECFPETVLAFLETLGGRMLVFSGVGRFVPETLESIYAGLGFCFLRWKSQISKILNSLILGWVVVLQRFFQKQLTETLKCCLRRSATEEGHRN